LVWVVVIAGVAAQVSCSSDSSQPDVQQAAGVLHDMVDGE